MQMNPAPAVSKHAPFADRAKFLPPAWHHDREDDRTSYFVATRRGTVEPADIPHEFAQGRATSEVFVRACRPVRILEH
jgi:hypothetical protein